MHVQIEPAFVHRVAPPQSLSVHLTSRSAMRMQSHSYHSSYFPRQSARENAHDRCVPFGYCAGVHLSTNLFPVLEIHDTNGLKNQSFFWPLALLEAQALQTNLPKYQYQLRGMLKVRKHLFHYELES